MKPSNEKLLDEQTEMLIVVSALSAIGQLTLRQNGKLQRVPYVCVCCCNGNDNFLKGAVDFVPRVRGRILLKNSCLIEVWFANPILPMGVRTGEDGTQAGSATGAVLGVLARRSRLARTPISTERRFVDLSSIRAHLANLYSHTGGPPSIPNCWSTIASVPVPSGGCAKGRI